jgi:hypothetical protein
LFFFSFFVASCSLESLYWHVKLVRKLSRVSRLGRFLFFFFFYKKSWPWSKPL